jgi:hypothetical protein
LNNFSYRSVEMKGRIGLHSATLTMSATRKDKVRVNMLSQVTYDVKSRRELKLCRTAARCSSYGYIRRFRGAMTAREDLSRERELVPCEQTLQGLLEGKFHFSSRKTRENGNQLTEIVSHSSHFRVILQAVSKI